MRPVDMVITSKTNEAIFAFVDSDEHEELAMEYVRELVRCKDCKHRPYYDMFFKTFNVPKEGKEICPFLNRIDWGLSIIPDDDFFCAYGEVKDDKL